jgi:hypothetical protein
LKEVADTRLIYFLCLSNLVYYIYNPAVCGGDYTKKKEIILLPIRFKFPSEPIFFLLIVGNLFLILEGCCSLWWRWWMPADMF